MSSRSASLAVAAIVSLGAPLLIPGAASATAPTGCAPIIALVVPGTTETTANADPQAPAGMLGEVGSKLEQAYGGRVDAKYVPYPGEAFIAGEAYASSKTKGDQSAAAVMAECPASQYAIVGYSQGGQVANDLVVNIGAGKGPVPASQVVAVVLLANPKRGTAGGQVYGPQLAGQGLAGPAAEGYGALSGRVWDICHPEDLYCNTDGKSLPFLASLGRVLGNTTGTVDSSTSTATATTATPGLATGATSTTGTAGTVVGSPTGTPGDPSALVTELTSPGSWENADLSALTSAASQVAQSVSTLSTEQTPGSAPSALRTAQLARQAQIVTDTLEPVSQARDWIGTTAGAQQTFDAAPAGSPEATTRGVLGTLSSVDVPGLLSAANQVSTTSNAILSGKADPAGSATTSVSSLAGAADTLVTGLSPLAQYGPPELRTATQVLSTAKPTTIVNQLLNVVTGVTSIDYLAVANGLRDLPVKIFTGDVRGAHQIAGDLNNQLSPFVQMAAGVDFKTLSRLVAMIPDPSGTAAITTLILDLLGNVDIVRAARAVGEIQEVAWSIAETGNVLELGRLDPVALELAQIAMGVLTPGTKMSPEQLHDPASAESALMSVQAQNTDLVGMGTSLLSLAQSDGAQALTQLVSEGFTAASFYASNPHISYPTWSPDGKQNSLDAMVSLVREGIGR